MSECRLTEDEDPPPEPPDARSRSAREHKRGRVESALRDSRERVETRGRDGTTQAHAQALHIRTYPSLHNTLATLLLRQKLTRRRALRSTKPFYKYANVKLSHCVSNLKLFFKSVLFKSPI